MGNFEKVFQLALRSHWEFCLGISHIMGNQLLALEVVFT